MNKIDNKKVKNFFCKSNLKLQNKSVLSKPDWIKIKLPTDSHHIKKLKTILRKNGLHTVCEEALCPNLHECFNNKTATFMILGAICTRNCPFCAVSYGRPNIVNQEEPKNLSKTVFEMGIKYVVITSVARDDLSDGGATQFINCIKHLRIKKNIKIEILVPDFRRTLKKSVKIISHCPPDIFNHNVENVPRLYNKIRPGANYYTSLKLLHEFKKNNSHIPTKSGLMLGLGETDQEIINVLKDLRSHGVNMLTLGQYLQPSIYHLPVQRYVTSLEFEHFKNEALSMGFNNAFCGSFVRSSYHANIQIQ